MLRPDRGIARVYLHRAPVDMRKQIDGLALLATEVICEDPTSGAVFGFINARRNKLKLLVWERNGFVVSPLQEEEPTVKDVINDRVVLMRPPQAPLASCIARSPVG